MAQNIPREIIIHHTASDSRSTSLRMIDDWHRLRKFGKSEFGYYIGYHFVIDMRGNVIQTRAKYEEGCHTKGRNLESIGICLIGNFDFEYPTIPQAESLGKLLKQLTEEFKIPINRILPHRYFSHTSCFGKRLADDWAQKVFYETEISRLKKILLWLQMQIKYKV